MHTLSLCIVNSRSNSFNICSPGPAEDDDEELVSAASQCEAQLNTGVADDINANIVTMFSDNTNKYYFVEDFYVLNLFFSTIQN